MNASVIGTGHVGLVTGAALAELGHNVLCVDQDHAKIEGLRAGRMPFFEPGLEPLARRNTRAGRLSFGLSVKEAVRFGEVIFICVWTPMGSDGAADLSYVEAVSREIAASLGDLPDTEYRVIVEKSTVPVQTGARIRQVILRLRQKGAEFAIVSNPEFLREGSGVHDALHPDRIVIGTDSERARDVMVRLYRDLKAPVLHTDVQSSELIKHASNSFLALRISFINAVACVCDAGGANIDAVSEGMGLDPRIGREFLRAGIGFGGSCFPKDVEAFFRISKDLGYEFNILREVQRINREQRERFLRRVERELWVLRDKVICVWGLSFKPGTDDLREAPSLYVIESLVGKQARVRAHDPVAIPGARRALPDAVEFHEDPLRAADGAEAILLLTDWPEYASTDLSLLRERVVHPFFFDGRNVFDPARMREAGWNYFSVGRPDVRIEP